ncbi:hypothetical protein SNOG_10055 [Parastagonospora nodorum SN15]|uniref:Uncharacterized protein n=1 Tax=Phaeosphaeria nodorum (strain SN15 / ATCC MYA-4574 / FGSC 10173) TaxID=321614 RepID=Q0UDV9_PHANO|nr:hypothetical protein SNOG_10055 [Parastagonospora nodorum SN15]EAT82390.1 hypothetical protein SNOG_10055 [Parastagonospora nodorum SN15]
MSGGDKYWEGRIMEDQGPVILAAKRARNGRSGKWSASPTLALGCASIDYVDPKELDSNVHDEA